MQTTGDLDKAFRLYVDKADSQGSADFLLGERQRFLNDAQTRLVRELVTDRSDDQGAVDLRRTLSKFADIPVTGNGGSNGIALPADYLAFGRARVQLRPPYENYNVPVKIISEDELSPLLEDSFNRPTIGEPVACFLHNELRLYPGGGAQSFELSYYASLPDLDLSRPADPHPLPAHLLPTLVQYAVQLALESVQDPRFQTQAAIAKATDNP